MKKVFVAIAVLLLAAGAAYWFGWLPGFGRNASPPPPPITELTPPSPTPVVSPSPDSSELDALLNEKPDSARTLPVPKPPRERKKRAAPPPPPPPKILDARAKGRKQREKLPMGVVLTDNVSVYADPTGRATLYSMRTGDFVRVYPDDAGKTRFHVHPGLDVYLALTSHDRRAAGDRLPDQPGWIPKENIQIFTEEQAHQFTESVDAITLGTDPSFSTLSFYERAMRNPDIVVHRVIGPRMISILGVHEDYMSAWGTLYRDYDSKIRSVTLAELKERGVSNSRPIIEDLIVRLSELTRERANGESEAEVLMILSILKESHHPRVKAALESFVDDWKGTQSDTVVKALNDLVTSAP